MSRWVATIIDPGCACCSYVAFKSFDSREEVPAEFWRDPNIDMFEEDDD